MFNSIIDILVDAKGEALDRRIEELIKKEHPYVNSDVLQEIFMKMESLNIIKVFRVSKNKKMIVLNRDTEAIRKKIIKDLV
ncbi:MAG: hypothetical protein BAJALOKI3v1_10139 [Promethearchaeota archaeon]|nr:MAG: hypothetical protein BAJALOKI3v1_10139 [Candidatus Lokiarchaeota archaeon]